MRRRLFVFTAGLVCLAAFVFTAGLMCLAAVAPGCMRWALGRLDADPLTLHDEVAAGLMRGVGRGGSIAGGHGNGRSPAQMPCCACTSMHGHAWPVGVMQGRTPHA